MLEKFAWGRWLTRTTRLFFLRSDLLHTGEIKGEDRAIMNFYNLFSAVYDLTFPQIESYKQVADHLVRTYVDPDDTVLDLGAGTGFLTLKIASRTSSVVAADLHHGMLLKAGRKVDRAGKVDRIRLCQANATQLPFADGRFDLVASAFMEVYLAREQKRAMLSEIHRILADGGRIVFMTAPGELARRYLRREEWSRLLAEAGFGQVGFEELHDVYRLVSAGKGSLVPGRPRRIEVRA